MDGSVKEWVERRHFLFHCRSICNYYNFGLRGLTRLLGTEYQSDWIVCLCIVYREGARERVITRGRKIKIQSTISVALGIVSLSLSFGVAPFSLLLIMDELLLRRPISW